MECINLIKFNTEVIRYYLENNNIREWPQLQGLIFKNLSKPVVSSFSEYLHRTVFYYKKKSY